MKKARTVKISVLFLVVVVFLFVVIIGRLSYIVLSPKVDGKDLSAFAQNRNEKTETIIAERGTIFDSLGNPLAQNVNSYTVIAILSETREDRVIDKEGTANQLSTFLNMTPERILSLLNTPNRYQIQLGPGGNAITELQKEQIESLGLKGIEFVKSVKRYYPNNDFLSYTLGYAKKNDDNSIVGEMGVELSYNKELTGQDGKRTYEGDIYGYKIANTPETVEPAENGKDIYLTIDTNIQMFTEQAVNKLEEASSLEWATISVTNAKTGEILGVASSPSFDPNIKEIKNYYDPFVSIAYEPGSTMKIFSFMAAIENGIYNGDEIYDSSGITIEDATIKDWNTYGWGNITFNQGFYGSSNVAASILSQRLGGQTLKDFYTKLGYGKKTNIGLPNEQVGKLGFQYPVEVANASFGQGMTVTHIQMVQALTSLANDGKILKPYLIKKIIDSETGEVILENKRTELAQVVSKETASTMRDMMLKVLDRNEITASGTRYYTDFVKVFGKTGTAQIASPDGGYLKGSINYTRSFVGMFPYDDPEIIIYIVTSKMSDSTLMTTSIKELIENVSTYLGIVDQSYKADDTTYTINSYVNKPVNLVEETLKDTKIAKIVIGNGDKVVNQYPYEDYTLGANDKLFLLTNGDQIKYANIEGWSRNDLVIYGKILGVTFNFNGYGYATNANLTDRVVVEGETIDINLSPKFTISPT